MVERCMYMVFYMRVDGNGKRITDGFDGEGSGF